MTIATEDLRLPYANQFEVAGESNPAVVPFRTITYRGKLPCRHWWGRPMGEFSGDTNTLVYPLIINMADLKYALPYIYGFTTANGDGIDVGGGKLIFKRTLPIVDPDGFGMYATKVTALTYRGFTGRIALQIPSRANVAPGDGNIYNSRRFFPYDDNLNYDDITGNPTNLPPDQIDMNPSREYRYAQMLVHFEHPPYDILSDDRTSIETPLFERARYMYAELLTGHEYVQLQKNVLTWDEGPNVGKPTGTGGAFIRPVGELKIRWFQIPYTAIQRLIPKWKDALGLTVPHPAMGAVNNADFKIKVANILGAPVTTFPAETLLYSPARMKYKLSAVGDLNYDLEMSMLWRPEGWNKYLFQLNRAYYRVVFSPDADGITTIYCSIDFEQLFLLG